MRRTKHFLLFFGALAVLAACNKSGHQKSEGSGIESKFPVMAMLDSATYDFGTIQEGDVVEHTFNFKNDGELPLIINNITSSCGCTTPEWPREPIDPAQTSSIKVRFDSKNKSGPQVKTITVYANTDPAYSEIKLRGIVNTEPSKK